MPKMMPASGALKAAAMPAAEPAISSPGWRCGASRPQRVHDRGADLHGGALAARRGPAGEAEDQQHDLADRDLEADQRTRAAQDPRSGGRRSPGGCRCRRSWGSSGPPARPPGRSRAGVTTKGAQPAPWCRAAKRLCALSARAAISTARPPTAIPPSRKTARRLNRGSQMRRARRRRLRRNERRRREDGGMPLPIRNGRRATTSARCRVEFEGHDG